MSELSIPEKNKLITEEILGECFCEHKKDEWSAMEMDSCYPDACDKCDKLMRGNRNFYEGDRSYKDIADALAKVPANTKMKSGFTQRGFLTHELWKRPGWEVVERDGGEEYVDQPWAFMTFSPPDVANALVAMVLETKP